MNRAFEHPSADIELEVRVLVGEKIIDRNVKSDLTFEEATLSVEMQRQAALYVYWSMLASEAESEVDRLEFEVDKTEAASALINRTSGIEKNLKMTESMISELVKDSASVQEARTLLIEAKKNAKMIKAVVRGLEHKREMMSSMAYRQREEMKTMRTSTVKEE